MSNNQIEFYKMILNNHNNVNERKNCKLVYSEELEKLAKKHIDELIAKKQIYHGNLPNNGLQNIASGKKNLLKDNVCVNLWMGDLGHRNPIVNSQFKKFGVAMTINSNNDVIIVANYSK